MNYPKALLPVGNETMLQRVVRHISRIVSPVAVIASSGQELPALPGDISVYFDREPQGGPLTAIGLGLEVMQGQCDAVFVSACDTPLIEEAVVQKLISILEGHQLAIVREEGRYHPLTAVYRTSLLETVQSLLRQDIRRAIDLVERVPAAFLEGEELRHIDPELRSLRNINTRHQYWDLLREIGLADSTSSPFGDEPSVNG